MLYSLDTGCIISLCLIDLITFGATILLMEPELIQWVLGITLIILVIISFATETDEEEQKKRREQAQRAKKEMKWEII